MKHVMVIYFLMASAVFAGFPNKDLMPIGFDKVHIGMKWRTLVTLRPNAEIMNMLPNPGAELKPDPGKPKDGLVEKLTTGPFNRVLYSFDDGALVAVMFGEEKGRSAPGDRNNVIRSIAQNLGMPIRIQIVGSRREQGVLTWQDPTLHINVMVPTDDANSTSSIIGLQIMNLNYAKRIKAIGVSGDAKKGNDPQDADKQRIETLKSEIKKLLSLKDVKPPEFRGRSTQ